MPHITPDLSNAIPRYRYVQGQDESGRDFLGRIASAVSFAFRIDPRIADQQPQLLLENEAIALPDGVVSRARARMWTHLVRDAELVRATGAQQLFIFFMRSGRIDMTPTRTGQPILAGDLLITDLAHAMELRISGYEYTLAVIDRGLLPLEVRDRKLHGLVLSREDAMTEVVTRMVEQLFDLAHRLTPTQASAVLRQAIQLLGNAVADLTSAGNKPLPLKAVAEGLVDEALADRALSPAGIAKRLGVSRATLYRAFEPGGGIRELIARRRLERAWMLASSSNGPSRDEITRSCGFRNARALDDALVAALGADMSTIRATVGTPQDRVSERAAKMTEASWSLRTGRH